MDVHAYDFDSLAEKEWKYPKIDEDARGSQLLLKAPGRKLSKEEIDRIANHVAKFNKIMEQARKEGT